MARKTALWGEEFIIPDNTAKVLSIIGNPKDAKKVINSKKLDINDKLLMIEAEVNRILGGYKDNTIVIKTEEEFKNYIDKAISNKIIAIDTETNNTLNTFDCKIMGLCLYTPGMKSAYIPVNHIDRVTNQRLDWQITEPQIASQLQRILDNNVYKIYHNAVFDIEVIQTTCGIRMKADWDTQVGAQLLDENEPKALKMQYRLHINPNQEKYDIEELFQGLEYAIFSPDLFALYAATDSFLTYELYRWQLNIFNKEENKDVLHLMQTIEIPVIEAIVDMELAGVEIDLDYAKKMSNIYHQKSNAIEEEIQAELKALKPKIDKWRTTDDANKKALKKGWEYVSPENSPAHVGYYYNPKTNKQVPESKAATVMAKSKSEQLLENPDLGSPTQLAILLYDVMKVPVTDKSKPRTTDSEALEILAEDKHIKLCEILTRKREVDILINTFIDKLPEFAQKDGRVHPKFNSTGTKTGRFSCSSPNMQQIPSHDKVIRMMFKASEVEHNVKCENNYYKVPYTDEVEVSPGEWKFAKDLTVGDVITSIEGVQDKIINIVQDKNDYIIYV